MADNCTKVVAVDDCAVFVAVSNNTGNVSVTVEVGIFDGQVFYRAVFDITKQTDFTCVFVVEIQTCDGFVVAVKGTGEKDSVISVEAGISRTTDRRPCTEITTIAIQCAVIVQHIAVHGNVRSQFTADGGVAVIYQCSKGVQFISGADFVVAVTVGVLQGDGCTGVDGCSQVRNCKCTDRAQTDEQNECHQKTEYSFFHGESSS